ncbi:MAG TPA: hypothetical protein VFX20_01205 [Steroidobacteraceae bacterium]|nr:hypothetical protein [Steroidobacteraceae bacterium]
MFRSLLAGALLFAAGAAAAQTVPPSLLNALSWREVGPYRGGRVDAVDGVAGKLNVAYFGSVDGGLFKTTDAGVTWQPLFQHEPVGSIGAVGVAPSNPQIIYVGTGEATIRSNATYGNGVYRSDDGGKTWQHLGLDDTQQIGRLLVDPQDPDRVVVAALGHVWGPNKERGIFLTTDGGKSWKQTLFVDEHTGAVDLARDPAQPASLYATTWNAERTPWYQYAPVDGPGSAIYHSNDNGATWQKLSLQGLPPDMGRIGVAVTDTASGPRLYAIVSAGSAHPVGEGSNLLGPGSGVYRSDDAGKSWHLIDGDPRLAGRGWYFGRIYADAKNPDLVYIPNTSLYRSRDGGAHFESIKGSPNGDDMHDLWLDPSDAEHMVLGADQGTSISLDDGAHWSSWFNQPTAQIYHFGVDDQVPYNLYATQQDSGALMIASRGPSGIITNHDWDAVGGGESGYLFPRKGDPSIIYGAGSGGNITRYDLRAHVTMSISPAAIRPFGGTPTPTGSYYPWNTAFAPSPFQVDTLYMGGQKVMRTTDAGQHWQVISPILTYKRPKAKCKGQPTRKTGAACGYSVIYALAASPVKEGVLWAGTDDSRLWLTQDDGEHWDNVTPPGLGVWSKVDTIGADPHDPASAYVAVERHQVDDFKPYIYITHDAGKHWRQAAQGIPDGDYVRVVRADPERKGLLYAGTEHGIFVSFDDGNSWQSLQRNLPTTAVRDLTVHDGDLIVGTSGRGFWILDDMEPLREASAAIAQSQVHLYAPKPAMRFRLGTYEGEARPPEVPHAANPPTGATIDYWLGDGSSGPVTLTIYDAEGQQVRHFSSTDQPAAIPVPNYPDYFTSPPNILPAGSGAHRFVWDLRYTPPAGAPHWGEPAVLGRTPRAPIGPLVLPGQYRVVLTVGGKEYSAPLTVRADPNAGSTPTALAANVHFALALESDIDSNAKVLQAAQAAANASGGGAGRQRIEDQVKKSDLDGINRQLSMLLDEVVGNDAAPTPTVVDAASQLRASSGKARDTLTGMLAGD